MLWLWFRRIYVCHFQDELPSLLGVSRTASSRDSGRFTFAVRDSRSISSYSSAFFQQGAPPNAVKPANKAHRKPRPADGGEHLASSGESVGD